MHGERVAGGSVGQAGHAILAEAGVCGPYWV